MGISFDDFHFFGMDKYDGGEKRWDFNHDGEMSIFEENCRRTYNELRYEMITEESDSESHYWGDDEDLKDAMDYMSPRERKNCFTIQKEHDNKHRIC